MKQVFQLLLPELRPYLKRMVAVIFFGVLIAVLKSATGPLLVKMTEAWNAHDEQQTIVLPLLIGGAWILAAALNYFHVFWMLYIAELVALNLRRQLMNKYLTLNLGFFNSFLRGSGGLISRMLNDIGIIQGGFQKVADLVREPITVVCVLTYLIYSDWKLTFFLLTAVPLVTGVLRKFAKSVRKYAHQNQESMEDLTQTLKESLDGTRVVQSFNLQAEMRQRFETQAQDFLRSKGKIIAREEASGSLTETLAAILVALLFLYIGQMILDSKMSVGQILGFVFALGQLTDALKKIQGGYIKVQQAAVALDRLKTILESSSVVKEASQTEPFPKNWREIEFQNVSFSYDQQQVLENINLKIKRGEQIALVGSSGAGKSTLINLLPRFFDPTEGQVLIGGIPIQHIDLEDLRKNVALVTQDVFLFSDSVERNIRSGDFSKDPEGVEEAAKLANAHEFITHTLEKYESRVGERGTRFSGGEKQRISIARAIFKDAPILILDEATSALDSGSELEVQKGLDSLMKGRTALIIAHRLSTIAKCDRILVMEKGQVIEEGSHNELMVRQGAYYRFFQLQSRL